MKYSVAASILAIASFAAAAPSPGGWDKKGHKNDDKKDYKGDWSPIDFSSTFHVVATPDQVVNNVSVSAPGEPGAWGSFNYGIIADLNVICYDIKLWGVSGAYSSPARTATHIHQGAKGRAGPPRIAFPNPQGDDAYRRSVGCLSGPFTTGVLANGVDTGVGFEVKQIEENPSAFFTDAHTAKFVPGAVRGQLS